ncbi:MAG: tetratricopeptide repeat protein, partial [Treponema sp.]|nr:tetratricopeptide repeat protein [Treponema sp.]
DVSILSGLTEALEKGEKIEEALQTIEEALYLDPENLSLQKQEISTLLSSKDYEEAFKKIDTLCKLNEDDVQLLDLYSQYYACMNDVESTNYYHNKIAKIDKNYKKHILSAAKRFSQIGEIDHAEQFAKAYIEKTNNDPEGYNTLGKLYSKSGDVDKAIVSYNKGLKLNKDNVYAGKQIAELLKSKIVNEPEEPSPIPVAEPESIPAEPNESFEVPTEEADFDFDSMGQNEKMMELSTSSEDEFWGALGTEFEDSSEADKIELPKKEPEIVGMEELADEESVKSLGDLAPELETEQSQGLPIEDGFDFDSFGFADDSEGEEIQGLSPIYESAEESPAEDFAEESSVVAGGGELETNQISENQTLSSETASLANQDEMIGNLKEKLQESIINSANLAVETAMNAQKMAQQVADEQSKISELQKALEEKQIETEQMQEELVMQQIKAEQLQQQLLEKQYEAENSVQQEPELESEPVIEQVSEPEIESQQEGLELVDNYDLLMNSEMNLEPIQSETTENSEAESEIKNEVGESTSQEYSDPESVEEKINFDGAVFEEDLLDLGLDEEPTEALPEESFEEVVEQSFELPEEAPVEETSEVKIEESEKETAEEELEELDNVEFTPIESEEDEITSQQMFYLVNDNIIPDVDEIIEDEKSLEIDDLIFDILIGEYEFPTVDAILADMLLKLSDEEIHIIKQFQAEKKSSDFEKCLASDALVTEDEFADVFEEESVIEEGAELYEENDEVFVNEEVSEQEYEETVDVQEVVNEDVVEQESQDVSELQQMFQKIESVLKDEDICQKYKSELEMFKKLKLLMDFIPQELSDSVNTNKLRVQIEYIIAKISGKPGLLKTVSSLIESGYFGEESEDEFQSLSQEELSQDQIKSVLEYAKKLALNLEDSVLSDSLCEVAEEIIQKI